MLLLLVIGLHGAEVAGAESAGFSVASREVGDRRA
jgi:hypothetical protein